MTTMLKLPPVAAPHSLSQTHSPVQAHSRSQAHAQGHGQPQPEAMTVNSVRMSSALEARLAEVAGRLRMSKSDVIRQALGEYLDKLEPVPPVADIEQDGGVFTGFGREDVRAA